MSKVLVVGAAGTVGRGVVDGLVQAGFQVKAATREPSKYQGAAKAEPVMLDLTRPETYSAALQGVDTMFQMCPPGYADAYGVLAPLVAAASKQVDKIVTMSAQGVDASDEIPLRRLELAVEATGLRYVHLRPSWFSQNFGTYWYPPIKKLGKILLPAEDSRTAFIDAEDISASVVASVSNQEAEGRAWELTGPEAVTYSDAAGILSEVSGRSISYQNTPEKEFRNSLLEAGLPSDYADLLVILFRGVRAGVAAKVTDAVRQLTGKEPSALRVYVERERARFES